MKTGSELVSGFHKAQTEQSVIVQMLVDEIQTRDKVIAELRSQLEKKQEAKT